MSLAPHERRALARIEGSLHLSDPALATMLATFTLPGWRGRRRGGPPWSWRRPDLLAGFALLTAAVSAIVLGLLLAGSSRRPSCSTTYGQRSGPRSAVACAPANSGPPAYSLPVGK